MSFTTPRLLSALAIAAVAAGQFCSGSVYLHIGGAGWGTSGAITCHPLDSVPLSYGSLILGDISPLKLSTGLLAKSDLSTVLVGKDALYAIGSEAQESMPMKWTTGLDATYDDHVVPSDEAIPEPAAALLAALSGLSLIFRRRR